MWIFGGGYRHRPSAVGGEPLRYLMFALYSPMISLGNWSGESCHPKFEVCFERSSGTPRTVLLAFVTNPWRNKNNYEATVW